MRSRVNVTNRLPGLKGKKERKRIWKDSRFLCFINCFIPLLIGSELHKTLNLFEFLFDCGDTSYTFWFKRLDPIIIRVTSAFKRRRELSKFGQVSFFFKRVSSSCLRLCTQIYLPPLSGVRNWEQRTSVGRRGAGHVSATCRQRASCLGIRFQPLRI